MITQKSVQEILETVKVEDIIQDFVSLKRRGVNMIGLCPFHNEKTPSFTVSPAKNIYKCFGCGAAGNAVKFLMEHENLSFPEALRYIANKYNIKIEEKEVSPEVLAERQRMDSLFIITQFARDFFSEQLFETDRGKSVGLSYFKQRGFREDIIRKFGLGYAPAKGDALTVTAKQNSYNIDLLKEVGLTSQYNRDFFRDRVMFTIHNLSGKVIGFGGRILQKDVKAPKYINSPETEIYNKSKVLYGAYFAKTAIRKQDECIMVEGYTDVISLHQDGIENVVASSGTSLTVEQILLVKRYTPNIKILYDGDKAGIKAALRGLDLVLAQDMNVKVVLLPDGEDPDSYLQSVGSAAFKEYLENEAKDFILFKTDLLLDDAGNDPIKRSEVIKDVVKSIAKVPDPIKRSLYVRECAKIVGVEEQLLVNESNKLVGKELKKRTEQQAKRKASRQPSDPNFPNPSDEPFFPTEEVGSGAMPLSPLEQKTKTLSGDEFQERDLARILVLFAEEIFDKEDQITVSQYLLENLEDIIDDFDNALYKKIVHLCMERMANGESLERSFFVNHSDQDIQKFTIDMMSSPYEYSENWEKKWELFLHSQKMPDKNFIQDSLSSLKRFRLRKLKKMLERNQLKIKELSEGNDFEQVMIHMKLHQKIKSIHDDLAKEMGSVVL